MCDFRRLWRRGTALLLGISLAALAACNNPVDSIPENDSEVPMGRYVEEQWELPVEVNGISNPVVRPDGRIELLLYHSEGVRYFSTSDGKDWREDPPDWFGEILERGRGPYATHYDSRGNGVVLHDGMDPETDDYTYEISLIATDGSLADTPIGKVEESFSKEEGGIIRYTTRGGSEEEELPNPEALAEEAINQFYASRVRLGEDGLVYASTFDGLASYDPETGALVQVLSTVEAGYDMAGGKPAWIAYQDPELDIPEHSVSLADSGREERMPAEMLTEYGNGDVMAGDRDGSLYLFVRTGIYRLAPGGETWERVLDGGLTSLTLPSLTPQSAVVHGDSQFLVLLEGSSSILMNYAYSSSTPTRPDKELTVYTLRDNATLLQAAGVFRQKNPGVLVNIRTLLEENTSATVDDAVRALNTELLAEKGPDLFLLDGLPLESYMEKGVLADLTAVVEPLLRTELLSNVAGSLERDGAYYAVPTRFSLPTVWGEEAAVARSGSLTDLAAYAAAHPDDRTFSDLRPERLINWYAPVYQHLWLGEGGQFDAAALAGFLEDIKALADTAGETRNLMEDDWNFSRASMKKQVDTLTEMMSYVGKDTSLMPVWLQGFTAVMQPNGAVASRVLDMDAPDWYENVNLPDDQVEKAFQPVGDGVFLPQSIVGVNAAGTQQELAMEFVQVLLGEGVQETDVEDGFPVNLKAMETNIRKEDGIFMSYAFADDSGVIRSIAMTRPSEAVYRAIAASFPDLNRPALVNEALLEMMLDESQAYFDGSATAEQAADAVAAKARILLAE